MKTRTIFEHDKPIEKYNFTKEFGEDRWNSLIRHIRRINRRFNPKDNDDGDKGILNIGCDSISAGSYVGVVATPVCEIEILPKVFKHTEGEEGEKRNRFGLVRLLSYTLNMPIKELGRAQLERAGTLLEYYIHIFASRLLSLLLSNLRHEFVFVEQNSRYLKGRLLVRENIRYNLAHKERFYCRYDEFMTDTLLNRILKFTCNLLLNFTVSSHTRTLLYSSLDILGEVRDVEITLSDLDRLRLTRLSTDYEPLIDLVRLFLSCYCPETAAGRHPALAIAFDMNKLFEKFCYRFIRAHRDEIISRIVGIGKIAISDVREQGKNGKNLFEDCLGGKGWGRAWRYKLKPDILMETSGGRIIIDTKYKPLDVNEDHLGIGGDDLRQMFTYLLKYDSKYGMLLFPKYDGDESGIERTPHYHGLVYNYKNDGEFDCHLFVRQVSLAPLSEDGGGWRNNMIKEFSECFDWIKV